MSRTSEFATEQMEKCLLPWLAESKTRTTWLLLGLKLKPNQEPHRSLHNFLFTGLYFVLDLP